MEDQLLQLQQELRQQRQLLEAIGAFALLAASAALPEDGAAAGGRFVAPVRLLKAVKHFRRFAEELPRSAHPDAEALHAFNAVRKRRE